MTANPIRPDFWYQQREINARRAIFHQWQQLEASGCIHNFRIAAGLAGGLREGWFFADSDAYKWLDAAARIYAARPDAQLAARMDALIELLAQAQMPDGYLFTYNQIHFPGVRWRNLQIEHELYCHGHLIEAGVAHHLATGRGDLLEIARKAADRIVVDFRGKDAVHTPGHEEIEIALLRLHAVIPGDTDYLDLARQFIEQRGRIPRVGLEIALQYYDVGRRKKMIQRQKQSYLAAHPDFKPYQLPSDNISKHAWNTMLRRYASALSGKMFQQHAPVREQVEPVGHSVRFGYFETATAMLARASGDRSLLPALEQTWQRMVTRRMYVTGGIGSEPGLEGFGRDYELNPEYAYAETCAALSSLFWSWEMVNLTGEAKYSDLFEWQLYNAAAVGLGQQGDTYLYNNPLECHGGVTRQPWYSVPCCPSNISRTWAHLEEYCLSANGDVLTVHQYITSAPRLETAPASLEIESGLPWDGRARLDLTAVTAPEFALQLRQPSWAGGMSITVNGEPAVRLPALPPSADATACGYDPRPALFLPLRRAWQLGDMIEIDFAMPMRLLRAHPKVKGHAGKAAVTRGPLVYCLESSDNPGVDIFTARLDPDSLSAAFDEALLGGIVKIQGKSKGGETLTFIPYFLWGNRGAAQMTVWINA